MLYGNGSRLRAVRPLLWTEEFCIFLLDLKNIILSVYHHPAEGDRIFHTDSAFDLDQSFEKATGIHTAQTSVGAVYADSSLDLIQITRLFGER